MLITHKMTKSVDHLHLTKQLTSIRQIEQFNILYNVRIYRRDGKIDFKNYILSWLVNYFLSLSELNLNAWKWKIGHKVKYNQLSQCVTHLINILDVDRQNDPMW